MKSTNINVNNVTNNRDPKHNCLTKLKITITAKYFVSVCYLKQNGITHTKLSSAIQASNHHEDGLKETTGWRTKCHTIDCTHNTFLLLQKHLTSGKELILIGCKIVPNEEYVQCDHRFASQPLANEPLHSSQLFDTRPQKARGTTSLCGP
jgi:hypothetical protein